MSLFHHRAFHNTIVVGEYLYIDGVEIVTWDGTGRGYASAIWYEEMYQDLGVMILPDNNTYSIDLSSSWTNSTVFLHPINKTAPVVNMEALWSDISGDRFYAYNGGYSPAINFTNITTAPPLTNDLWQFLPEGRAGIWSQTSYNGVGYALGGEENSATNYYLFLFSSMVGGMTVYNSVSQKWLNISSTGYSFEGTSGRGAAHFVPDYGPDGLLFILGGVANGFDSMVPLDSISMYEPTTQSWQTQRTSGEALYSVVQPCAVGTPGNNGTYEIFFYGGAASPEPTSQDTGATVQSGRVHVLTLPAFRWISEAATPSFGRYFRTCNVIGNRQMVSVGGRTVTAESTLVNIPTDPWPKGIGIFDMTNMEWTNQYDPNAASYVTPAAIKSYYQNNGLYPTKWSSNTLERWCTHDTQSSNNPSNGTTVHPDSSKANTGAIADGVIGGVAALMLMAFVIWLLFRRKRKLASKASAKDVANHQQEIGVEVDGHEMLELEVDDPSRIPGGWEPSLRNAW